MAVPVLRALLDQFPQLKITVLTKPRFVPIFESLPQLNFLTPDFNDRHKGLIGLFRLAKDIRKLGIDAIADLHNVLRTNVLKLFLNGFPFVQVDKGRGEKKALVKGKIFRQLLSTHKRYADVFRKLGYSISLDNPTFPEKHKLKIDQFFPQLDSGKYLIGIAPFAAHPSKMYPLNLMEEVIEELSEKYQIVLFGGGKEEKKVLERIENQNLNVVSAAGKLPLEKELALISKLNLMISMDSGNGHLAAIYGLKVLTVWGVTHPFAGFTPFNQAIENSLMPDRAEFPLIPTSVYGNKFPKHYLNVAGTIEPSTVVRKVEEMLG